MKLYYAPGVCSLASHIALYETNLPFTTVKVDLRKHTLADGSDYYAVNPNGYVPLLELDDGTRLAEGAVILQYIADRKPGTIAPAFGSIERYRVMEWLNFVATEVHKQFSPLWYPTTPDATKDAQRAKLATRFDYLSGVLASQPYLTGSSFTIADAYLFTILNWAPMLKLDLTPWPALDAVPGARRCAARGAPRDGRRRPREGRGREGDRVKPLPTLFLSHGSPMHAVEPGAAGRAWAALGRDLPRPHADSRRIGALGNPGADADGQPEAGNDPRLRRLPRRALHAALPGAGRAGARDPRGRPPQAGGDHRRHRRLSRTRSRRVGAAACTCCPRTTSRSCRSRCSPRSGPRITSRSAARSRRSRSEGILIVGSGHTTHNLRDWMANRKRTRADALRAGLHRVDAGTLDAHDTQALVEYRERAPAAERAHPTEEHLLPLHVAWGAAGDSPRVERVVTGFEAGALALDSWLFYARLGAARTPAPRLPPRRRRRCAGDAARGRSTRRSPSDTSGPRRA